MSDKKYPTPSRELAVVGALGQLLQDHAVEPFTGIFAVTFREDGYGIYYGGLPTEPENAADCLVMVLEATKALRELAEPPPSETPHLALIKGDKA